LLNIFFDLPLLCLSLKLLPALPLELHKFALFSPGQGFRNRVLWRGVTALLRIKANNIKLALCKESIKVKVHSQDENKGEKASTPFP